MSMWPSIPSSWLLRTFLLLSLTAITSKAIAPFETPASRQYFYVGGEYVSDGQGGSVFRNQLYVEHLTPVAESCSINTTLHVKPLHPIVFWHGQAQTGTNWLNTPDGRPGWASYFLSRCHEVYIVDQPQRGRSAHLPGDGTQATFSAETIARLFTGIQYYGAWPQAKLHRQWPGNGTKGDPIFDQFYASQVQFQNDSIEVSHINQRAGASLLTHIGRPIVLVSHSQAGPLSYLIADSTPHMVTGLLAIEPQGPPFSDRIISSSNATVRQWGLSNIPLTYEPPIADPAIDLIPVSVPPPVGTDGLTDCLLQKEPARKLARLSDVPMAVMTGEASFHAGFDYCEVAFLKQAGVKNVREINLSAMGVHGNGHFVFLERNNWEIAGLVEEWIEGLPEK